MFLTSINVSRARFLITLKEHLTLVSGFLTAYPTIVNVLIINETICLTLHRKMHDEGTMLLFKVRERAKIRNRCNQAPHLTQDTNWKVTTSQLDITNESQEVSTFPAGDHKASINRCARKHNKTRKQNKTRQKQHLTIFNLQTHISSG